MLRRIAELRRQGLWSARKMPRCVDPPRNKTHWDYLLEEMQWMAIDFEQERKWKRSAARKVWFSNFAFSNFHKFFWFVLGSNGDR